MGCSGCSTGSSGKPNGCKSNGGCSTGGCNRLNTFDWLSSKNFYDPMAFNIVEVSFKNGARKSFFWNDHSTTHADTGDFVLVETGSGTDVGLITLSGDLVRAQMRKKRFKEERVVHKVLRKAGDRDMERMEEARSKEKGAMVKARVIARSLGLDMKVGDVEYQADQRKATFYYTAEGRIDFRELVRNYAKEFRVKIEMRQIGARQESGRIGGIGSCGRELCCSTWLTEFKSVNTSAARYQNLAINQSKLSGQCGRLKCCLNYELDTYLDALQEFPKKADVLMTKAGKAVLVKTDIFKRLMFYCYEVKGRRGHTMPITIETVKKVLAMNARDEMPEELDVAEVAVKENDEADTPDFADITGDFEMPELHQTKKKRPNRKKRRPSKGRPSGQDRGQNQKTGEAQNKSDKEAKGQEANKGRSSGNKRRKGRRYRGPKSDNQNKKEE